MELSKSTPSRDSLLCLLIRSQRLAVVFQGGVHPRKSVMKAISNLIIVKTDSPCNWSLEIK